MIIAKAINKDYTYSGYKNTLRELFETIEKTDIKTQEYTLWREYIFHHFSDCILSRIESSFRHDIDKIFIMYRQGKL